MDWNAVGIGLGIGLIAAIIPIVLFLPASYIMNRFIYHHWALRLLMGLFVGHFPVISLIVVACLRIFVWTPTPFFGLLPLYSVAKDMELPGGYFTILYRIFYSLIYPFVYHENPADYKAAITPLLVPETSSSTQIGDIRVYKEAVPEFFFKGARHAGTIADTKDWTAYMNTLEQSGVGKYIYGPGESGVKQEQS